MLWAYVNFWLGQGRINFGAFKLDCLSPHGRCSRLILKMDWQQHPECLLNGFNPSRSQPGSSSLTLVFGWEPVSLAWHGPLLSKRPLLLLEAINLSGNRPSYSLWWCSLWGSSLLLLLDWCWWWPLWEWSVLLLLDWFWACPLLFSQCLLVPNGPLAADVETWDVMNTGVALALALAAAAAAAAGVLRCWSIALLPPGWAAAGGPEVCKGCVWEVVLQ